MSQGQFPPVHLFALVLVITTYGISNHFKPLDLPGPSSNGMERPAGPGPLVVLVVVLGLVPGRPGPGPFTIHNLQSSSETIEIIED
jgi:hypothetical protein